MDDTVVIDIVAQVTDRTSGGADRVSRSLEKLGKFAENVQREFDKMRRMSRLEVTVYAADKASKVIDSVFAAGKRLTGKVWSVTLKVVDFVTAPFRGIIRMISNPLVALGGIAGISLGAKDVISTFMNFEQGMANVKAITKATDSEFQTLVATAKQLGSDTVFTASEAAEGMQYLGMAGWKTNEIVAGMPGLLDLAAAGATDLGTAADIVSDVMTAFGISADKATHTADVFAETATSSNTNIQMLGETMKYAAPVAKVFGMSLEQTAAMAGLMANAGIKASQAGTAIRSSLMRLADPEARAEERVKTCARRRRSWCGRRKYLCRKRRINSSCWNCRGRTGRCWIGFGCQ